MIAPGQISPQVSPQVRSAAQVRSLVVDHNSNCKDSFFSFKVWAFFLSETNHEIKFTSDDAFFRKQNTGMPKKRYSNLGY